MTTSPAFADPVAPAPPRRVFVDLLLFIAAVGLAWVILTSVIGPRNLAPATGRPRAVILADPLDVRALRGLGLEMDQHGQSAAADALMTFAGQRSWRDGPTQAWLFQRRLQQGRYMDAFRHADSLLRRDTGETFRERMFVVLDAAARYDEVRPALVDRLAASPWWRPPWLRQMAASGDTAAAGAILAALDAGPHPPAADEISPYIERLVAAGDYAGALRAWTAWVHPGPDATLLRDGDFTGTPDRTAFSWRAASGVGAESDVRADASASSLRVEYDGFSQPILPGQLLVLAPGAWRLTWRQRAAGVGASRLAWTVRCPQSATVLARAPPPTPGWRKVSMTFQVPASKCGGQWLELLASPGERRDPEVAWYASFRLVPAYQAGPS